MRIALALFLLCICCPWTAGSVSAAALLRSILRHASWSQSLTGMPMRMHAGSTYTGAWKSGKMHGKGTIASNGHEVKGIWEEGVCKQTIDADFDTLKGIEMGVSLSQRLLCVCRGKCMLAFVCLCVVVRSLCAGFRTAAQNGELIAPSLVVLIALLLFVFSDPPFIARCTPLCINISQMPAGW